MTRYLLLRDNKESGPFSVEELQNFGLKPYDLIWVEGKSAAWRYPSEIVELKPFAPVVEEQPFDRFFKKKNEPEKKEVIPPVTEEKYSRFISPEREEVPRSQTPRRSVFVTLPDNQQVELKKDTFIPEKKQAYHRSATVTSEIKPEPVVSITESPEEAEIKYSRPLDEIKQMYVKTLQERKDKRAKKGLLIGYAKKAAVVVGLIGVGVLAGFIVRSKPVNRDIDTVSADMLKVSTAVNHALPEQEIRQEDIDEKSGAGQSMQKTNGESTANSNGIIRDEEPVAPLRIRKETMIIVPKKKEDYSRQDTPGANINAITGERDSRLRTENGVNTFLHKKANDDLKNLVSVSSNDYKRVAFGGIRNLFLTVNNHSPFALDEVIVELQYLKPSEEPLRTENISFKSIAANKSSTVRIPDTNRGIKVSYRIINIESRQNDLASGQ